MNQQQPSGSTWTLPPAFATVAPRPTPTLTGFDAASTAAGASGTGAAGTAAGETAEKPPIERPKLDESRLLEPDALPFIRNECKKIKFKAGKGTEVENLGKLVTFYKTWAHRVFPKYPFERFVERSMRVCRTRRLKAHLSEWIAEEMRAKYPTAGDGYDDRDGEGGPGSEFRGMDEDAVLDDILGNDLTAVFRDVSVNSSQPSAPFAGGLEDIFADDDRPMPPPPPRPTVQAAAPGSASSSVASAKERALQRLAEIKSSRFRAGLSQGEPSSQTISSTPVERPASGAGHAVFLDIEDSDDDAPAPAPAAPAPSAQLAQPAQPTTQQAPWSDMGDIDMGDFDMDDAPDAPLGTQEEAPPVLLSMWDTPAEGGDQT
ncbi:hypothetical protein H9P43_008204 [Blastocladiella emersonii ATCC 22665]|nr:hypothetical protein H9P43_008204 [Blastocladiella emersonii ATCC 22665]